jgi:hypothetical protein
LSSACQGGPPPRNTLKVLAKPILLLQSRWTERTERVVKTEVFGFVVATTGSWRPSHAASCRPVRRLRRARPSRDHAPPVRRTPVADRGSARPCPEPP